MYRLITFDVHGTLLKLKKPIGELYSEVASDFGICADPEKLNACFKEVYKMMNERHVNFGKASIGWEEWWKQLVQMTFQCAQSNELLPMPDEHLQAVSNKLLDICNTKEGWSVLENSVEFLEHLKKRQFHMGVISNFDPRLHNVLREMCLDNFFSFIITSYECGYPKPDTRIFLKAKELYESETQDQLEPSLALHIGDSVEFDYLGAKNAGWHAALIHRDDSVQLPCTVDKKHVFHNFKHLQMRLLS